MKVVELHPEELLDRAELGELTEAEQARLDAHLVKCATCRFERSVRTDFADELSAHERPSKVGLLVADAIRVTSIPPPAPTTAVVHKPARARRMAVLLVAAAVTMAGAAGANGWVGRAWEKIVAPQPAAAPADPAPMPSVTHTRAPHASPVVMNVPPPEPVPEPTIEPVPEPVTPPPPVRVVRTAVPDAPSAAELFDEANEARRRGDHVTAVMRYRELQARAPRSEEAKTSLVTMGRMQLDEGNFRDALVEFEAYLRDGGGELREEAMTGRARALERLGHGADEAEAWRALLAAYPGSPYTLHARSRLAALGTR